MKLIIRQLVSRLQIFRIVYYRIASRCCDRAGVVFTEKSRQISAYTVQ